MRPRLPAPGFGQRLPGGRYGPEAPHSFSRGCLVSREEAAHSLISSGNARDDQILVNQRLGGRAVIFAGFRLLDITEQLPIDPVTLYHIGDVGHHEYIEAIRQLTAIDFFDVYTL